MHQLNDTSVAQNSDRWAVSAEATEKSVEIRNSNLLILGLILCFAAMLRIWNVGNWFGVDELNYHNAIVGILEGRMSEETYIAGLRYGFNFIIAGLISVFGHAEIVMTGFAMTCSLAEVVLVYFMASKVWGTRTGLCAAFILASLPLHVATGSTLLSDAYLALTISASFVLFYLGETTRRRSFYFAAGLVAGWVYWIKEAVALSCLAFFGYAASQRTWRRDWNLVIAGLCLVVAASFLFFWHFHGDPLKIPNSLRLQRDSHFIGSTIYVSSPGYYLTYLFVKAYYTWILGYFAIGGLTLWMLAKAQGKHSHDDTEYVVIWLIGLIVIFSLFPISFSPFQLIAKQPLYMAIFLAPLALMAGKFIAALRGKVFGSVIVIWSVGALLLISLNQYNMQSFKANSRAAYDFALNNRDAPVFGTTANSLYSQFISMFRSRANNAELVQNFESIDVIPDKSAAGSKGVRAYIVVDHHTMGWSTRHIKIGRIPSCWKFVHTLTPSGFGFGKHVYEGMAQIFTYLKVFMPNSVARKLESFLKKYQMPRGADVYAITDNCQFKL